MGSVHDIWHNDNNNNNNNNNNKNKNHNKNKKEKGGVDLPGSPSQDKLNIFYACWYTKKDCHFHQMLSAVSLSLLETIQVANVLRIKVRK